VKRLLAASSYIVVFLTWLFAPAHPTSTNAQEQAPQAPPLKTVAVRGTELSYVEQGRGEPVILIHGFMHDYRVWSEQWPELSKHYRVIAYSRRYHHPNPWPADAPGTSLSADEADLVALIEALDLGPVHLIGHSAGAFIAATMARDHPDLVRSVILAEPHMQAILARSPEAQAMPPPAFFEQARKAFEQGKDEEALRIIAAGIIGTPDAYDQIPPERRRIPLDNLRLGKAQMLSGRPQPSFTCEDAQSIQAPTLLLEGDRTLKMFQLGVEELHKCMPGSERAVLAKATHALELENPAGFNEIVLEFLARHSGRDESEN